MKEEEKEVGLIAEVELETSVKALVKEGDSGLIAIIDLDDTRARLEMVASKYQGLVITEDNYKKEGGEAELVLRRFRYDLQKVRDHNKRKLLDAKKASEERLNELIGIIEPIERTLKSAIKEISDRKSEEKRLAKEAESKKKQEIENSISDFRTKVEAWGESFDTEEKMLKYGDMRRELSGLIEDEFFEELTFEAKEISAMADAYSGEIVDRVNKKKEQAEKTRLEEEEREKEEARIKEEVAKKEGEEIIKAKKRAEEEQVMKEQVFEIRKPILISMGFDESEEGFRLTKSISVSKESVRDINEVDWYRTVSDLKEAIEAEKAKLEANKAELNAESKKMWADLNERYKELSGEKKKFAGEYPTLAEIDAFRAIVKELSRIDRNKTAKIVKQEIEPYKDGVLNFFNEMGRKIREDNFQETSSRQILDHMMNQFSVVVDEVLGDVMNGEKK